MFPFVANLSFFSRQALLSSLLVLLPMSLPSLAWGAACCGGGFALPSLISGDERAQVSLNLAYSELHTMVDGRGIWQDRELPELSQSFRLEGAMLVSDLWQVGLSIPFTQRARGSHQASGLGDLSANLGYEYLSDWDYHPWRPKALAFLQLNAPTGESIYDGASHFGLKAQGRGFWSLGAGTLVTKIKGPWDFFALFEMRRSLPRDFQRGQEQLRLVPGWGGNAGFGLGFNTAAWRFGPSITWSYEDPLELSGSSQPEESSLQRWATGSLTISYLAHEDWAASLSYQDQSLFGRPQNTALARGLSLFVQHKWPR